jgi:DNA replication protein DnaC
MAEVPEPLQAVFRELVTGRAKWPLFLHGSVGTGKTCATLALCDIAKSGMHRTVEELADDMLRAKFDLWPYLAATGLAVLDEVGARANVGDLHYQVVQRFADCRDCKPAIFVSNLAPDQIGKLYDDRIASRLLCGSWFELSGEDRRMT